MTQQQQPNTSKAALKAFLEDAKRDDPQWWAGHAGEYHATMHDLAPALAREVLALREAVRALKVAQTKGPVDALADALIGLYSLLDDTEGGD